MRGDDKKRLTVVGGTYRETCMCPEWQELFGSGLRAAIALKKCTNLEVDFYTRCLPQDFARVADRLRPVRLHNPTPREVDVGFEYVHPLSIPIIRPRVDAIEREPLSVVADDMIVYGMLDAKLEIKARRVVYDPQSPGNPRPFTEIGNAAEVAVVLNRSEAKRLAEEDGDEVSLATVKSIRARNRASIVVIKKGLLGADVWVNDSCRHVPAYRSGRSFPIGSGDMFTATFAYHWLCNELAPEEAADRASRIVAEYSKRMGHAAIRLDQKPDFEAFEFLHGTVYLASPFFGIAELWLVNEIRRELQSRGLEVKSPVHIVGPGDAKTVGPKDIDLMKECDRVFAVLDNFDPGTNYELGWAKANDLPIVAVYSPGLVVRDDRDRDTNVGDKDDRLKMVYGNGAYVYDDLATALDAVCGVKKGHRA